MLKAIAHIAIIACFLAGCRKDITPSDTSGAEDFGTDYTKGFSEELGRIEVDGKRGFIDTTGKVVIQPQFQLAWDCSCGRIMISQGGKIGFVDKTGKIVVAPRYDGARAFHEGKAAVMVLGKWGFIDLTGNVVIPLVYDQVPEGFSQGRAAVASGKKYGFLDANGKLVIPTQYDDVRCFSLGLAPVKKDGLWGFVDQSGQYVIPPTYTWVCFGFAGDSKWAAVSPDGLPPGTVEAFIDTKGKTVLTTNADCNIPFNEGMCGAVDTRTKPHRMGFIDTHGNWAIPAKFSYAGFFIGGLADVQVGPKAGFVDKNGNIVIPLQFTQAMPFQEGFARVCVNGKWGYIDRSGKYIWKPSK